MKIDPSLEGKLPRVGRPEPFAKGGRKGWKISIPGGRPLATPAVVDGRIYLGGGFGSYDFYALDALTGELRWQYQTQDDGPTAAVVAEDCVVFNTESCELEVLSTEGRRLWKKWLGDPLLSMPAVHDGRVFMAYPESRGDRRHFLACFRLTTGDELWRTPIAGEIITCPVLADGQVYLSNLDGTLACFDQETGAMLWREDRKATSSPTVWRQQCYFSQRSERPAPRGGGVAGSQQMESVSYQKCIAGVNSKAFAGTVRDADYLDHDKRQHGSPVYGLHDSQDAAVGFGGHKGDSKMHQAMHNLGHGHVSSIWAYQGSKPFIADDRLYSGLGDTIHCADPVSEEVHWKKKVGSNDADENLLDSQLTPPDLVNGKLFVGTLDGRVVSMSAATSEVLWSVDLGEPVVFQPTVARGRVYVPTANGHLYCLETDDLDDDGWLMWGGTSGHNGVV